MGALAAGGACTIRQYGPGSYSDLAATWAPAFGLRDHYQRRLACGRVAGERLGHALKRRIVLATARP
jgi:hypothetical protein